MHFTITIDSYRPRKRENEAERPPPEDTNTLEALGPWVMVVPEDVSSVPVVEILNGGSRVFM